MTAPHRTGPRADLTELRDRVTALRQAAELPGAELDTLLGAALEELDGALDALLSAQAAPGGENGQQPSNAQTERRLLHAVFTATPVPLFVTDKDTTVLRANAAAAELLGVGPGYATGRQLTALIEPSSRAALRSRLAGVLRTGQRAVLACGMLAGNGSLRCRLAIATLSVRGDADRLLIAMSRIADDTRPDAPAGAAEPGPANSDAAAVATAHRRLDLLAAAARLLLESAGISESVLLQRCGRLLSGDLATWVIIDVHRRDQLRRQYVAGPDDPDSAALAHAVASVAPGPGSVPDQVFESGKAQLLTHLEDETALGRGPDGSALLPRLGAASLLAVPMADGQRSYGTLSLVRRGRDGQFSLSDAALAQEIGAMLGLAISARRTLRRRTEAADALRASLLPTALRPVPGVEVASAHIAPTRGREVGGDFYDAYPTPGGFGLAIGDVCGKGDDAAAATAAARHAIRVLAHSTADPASVLRGANDIMLAEEFGGRFVTACAAHLSWHDDTLAIVLATAGHPGPVLVRPDGSTQHMPGGGVPLGIFPDPEPATLELQLSAGDVLFFYTDGLADARSPQAVYLEDSLTDYLAQSAGRRAADIVSDMRGAVLDFSGGVLLDDLTMLALRAGAPPGS